MAVPHHAGMIVDAHAHFVRPGAGPSPALPRVHRHAVAAGVHRQRPPETLLAALAEAGIDKVVQATPGAMAYDNDFAIGVAHEHPDRIRVVAHVDHRAGDSLAAEVRRLATEPMVVGVRVLLLDPGDHAEAERAIGALDPAPDAGLPVCVYSPGRPETVGAMARRWPGSAIVVEHAGLDVTPGTPDASRAAALPGVLALADHANVSLKVSLPEVTPQVEGPPFPTAAGLLELLVDRFGAERLMWGSNYPLVLERCSLQESLEWLASGCDFLSPARRAALLAGTACRVFGLPWAPDASAAP